MPLETGMESNIGAYTGRAVFTSVSCRPENVVAISANTLAKTWGVPGVHSAGDRLLRRQQSRRERERQGKIGSPPRALPLLSVASMRRVVRILRDRDYPLFAER